MSSQRLSASHNDTPASSRTPSPAQPVHASSFADQWPFLRNIYNGKEPSTTAETLSISAQDQRNLWQEIHAVLDKVTALMEESLRTTQQVGSLQQQLDLANSEELVAHGAAQELREELAQHREQLAQAREQLGARRAQDPTMTLSSEHPDPEPFDGSVPANIADFILQMRIKLHVNSDRYPDPTSRLGYFVSRLKLKALQQVKFGLTPEGRFAFKDVDEMIQVLEASYGNAAPKATAGRDVLALRQEKRPLQEFLPDWQKFAYDSGFDDVALISILRNAIHFRIAERLTLDPASFTVDSLPAFLVMVRGADSILRILYGDYFKEALSNRSTGAMSSTPNVPFSQPRTAPLTVPAPEEGDPMDLSTVWTGSQGGKRRPKNETEKRARREYCFKNNLCLFCESPKHRINDCPLRPVKHVNTPSATTSPEN